MKQVSLQTKIFLGSGGLFTVYGLFCREFKLYFFWESQGIGWTLILLGAISFLVNSIMLKKSKKRKYLIELILIGVVCLICFLNPFLLALNRSSFSAAYSEAKNYIQNNTDIKNEVGASSDFGFISIWGTQIGTDPENESEYAVIATIVKGDKKYKDVQIYLTKKPNESVWVVDTNLTRINASSNQATTFCGLKLDCVN